MSYNENEFEELLTFGKAISVDENEPCTIIIEFNWKVSYVSFKLDENNSPNERPSKKKETVISIENERFESKEMYIESLISCIQSFALLNIHYGVKLYDLQLPKSQQMVYETARCETFRDKVYDLSGLNRLNILEINSSELQLEIYFFVIPDTSNRKIFKSILITPDYVNIQATDLLHANMINALKNFDTVLFLGKVELTIKDRMKSFVEFIISVLLKRPVDTDISDNISIPKKERCTIVDLTLVQYEEDCAKIDEATYNELMSVSEIMEEGPPLSDFYNKEVKSIIGDWDSQVDLEKYLVKSYDKILMERFVSETMMKQSNPENMDIDDDVEETSKVKNKTLVELFLCGDSNTPTLNQKGKDKIDFQIKFGASKRKPKIKSNIFNDNEVKGWINSTNYVTKKDKAPNGPSSRRPIREQREYDNSRRSRIVISSFASTPTKLQRSSVSTISKECSYRMSNRIEESKEPNDSDVEVIEDNDDNKSNIQTNLGNRFFLNRESNKKSSVPKFSNPRFQNPHR